MICKFKSSYLIFTLFRLASIRIRHTYQMTAAKNSKEEKELVDNLAKFNTFVKEKKLKVERALKTEMEEKTMRKNMTVEIGKIWAHK